MYIQRYRFIALVMLACLIGLSLEGRGQSQATGKVEVLTLEQAVALALRDNPKLRAAGIDINRAAEDFAALRTRRLPNFSFNITATQQLTPIDFTFEKGVFGTYPGIGPIPGDTTKITTPIMILTLGENLLMTSALNCTNTSGAKAMMAVR